MSALSTEKKFSSTNPNFVIEPPSAIETVGGPEERASHCGKLKEEWHKGCLCPPMSLVDDFKREVRPRDISR